MTTLEDHLISAPNTSNYKSVNPNDGTTAKTFPTLTSGELETKLAAADACFAAWKTTTYAQRAAIIAKAAALLRANVDAFAELATLEMGKRFAEAQGEVRFSADILDYYATNSEVFLQPVTLHPATGEGHMESSPFGVLFCVEPWNFPYYQLARVAGPHLMAGNTLVVKHAGCVPQCAIAFEKLLLDAGAPVGAYTNLAISHTQSDDVIDDPRIKGVALTGSVAAGRSIAARAGMNLKKSSMELGGSDAFIVLEDADLDKAVKHAVGGRMGNTGQACTASKRIIVVEAIADAFLQKFSAAMAAFKPGDPMDERTTLGPLSSAQALATLLAQVDEAVEHGAHALIGGKRIGAMPGAFMAPTILTGIDADNPVFKQEFFGPVALFFRVADEKAAVALANDSPFGLGGSVFTKDTERGKRVARQIETGMVFINSSAISSPELPFGGVKNSGYGRELSGAGIQEFVNKKLIRVN